MAILRTWQCAAHGEFQAFVGKCKYGCGAGMVTQVLGCNILTAKTKTTDRLAKQLASDLGLSDMNNRGGQALAEETSRWEKKKISDQTYSVPVGKGEEIAKIAAKIGAPMTESNIAATMRQQGAVSMRTNVIADDKVRIRPEDIK